MNEWIFENNIMMERFNPNSMIKSRYKLSLRCSEIKDWSRLLLFAYILWTDTFWSSLNYGSKFSLCFNVFYGNIYYLHVMQSEYLMRQLIYEKKKSFGFLLNIRWEIQSNKLLRFSVKYIGNTVSNDCRLVLMH